MMFALEEPFNSALTLLYSHLTPSKTIICSHSNAIITCTSTSTALSFLECQEVDKELKFLLVNVCVLEGG